MPTTGPIAILLRPKVEKMPTPEQVNQPVFDAVAMDKPAGHKH